MYLGLKIFEHSGFLVFRVQTNKNIFDIRKIFVSWRAKHEAIYIVNIKNNKAKILCLAYNIYCFTNCSYIRCT